MPLSVGWDQKQGSETAGSSKLLPASRAYASTRQPEFAGSTYLRPGRRVFIARGK